MTLAAKHRDNYVLKRGTCSKPNKVKKIQFAAKNRRTQHVTETSFTCNEASEGEANEIKVENSMNFTSLCAGIQSSVRTSLQAKIIQYYLRCYFNFVTLQVWLQQHEADLISNAFHSTL